MNVGDLMISSNKDFRKEDDKTKVPVYGRYYVATNIEDELLKYEGCKRVSDAPWAIYRFKKIELTS